MENPGEKHVDASEMLKALGSIAVFSMLSYVGKVFDGVVCPSPLTLIHFYLFLFCSLSKVSCHFFSDYLTSVILRNGR